MDRNGTDDGFPIWFDGKSVNEALFCEEYLKFHKLIFINGAFFTPDGRITDELPLRKEIYEDLKNYAGSNLPRKIGNILEILKLEIVRNRLSVSYNPNAKEPVVWKKFLDGLLYQEDILTLQEFIGYCLILSNKGQRIMI